MPEHEFRIVLTSIEPDARHDVAPLISDFFSIGIPQSERVVHKVPACLLGNLKLTDAFRILAELKPLIEAGAGIAIQPHGRVPVRMIGWPRQPAILKMIEPQDVKGVLTHCPHCHGAVQFPMATLEALSKSGRHEVTAKCPRCGQAATYDLNKIMNIGSSPARPKEQEASVPPPPESPEVAAPEQGSMVSPDEKTVKIRRIQEQFSAFESAPEPEPSFEPIPAQEPKPEQTFDDPSEYEDGEMLDDSLFLDELDPLPKTTRITSKNLNDIVEFESGLIDLYSTEADDLETPL